METNNYQKEQISILNGQLIGCILYIISILISIVIILNQRKKALEKEGFLPQDKEQELVVTNKIIILLLTIFFLYLNYESLSLTKKLKQDPTNLELLIIGSYLAIIIALIGLYVVSRKNTNSFTDTEAQNP